MASNPWAISRRQPETVDSSAPPAPEASGNPWSAPTVAESEPFVGTEPEAAGEGISPGAVVAGGAALAGGGYALSKLANAPGILGKLGKLGGMIAALRQQSMLSGLAIPKSALGNVGAGIEQAAEGKGLRALKEILSPQTMREAVQAMKTPAAMANNPAGAGGTQLPWWAAIPGRVMGGLDEATQSALRRSGMNATEAQSAVLQAPLKGNFSTMESGPARWLFPFRRTPFNQFFEGLGKLKAAEQGDKAAQQGLAIYGAAGATHGAATADEQYPMSVPIATAMAARYGLPYAAAAIAGRALAGKKDSGGIAGSALPVSEYGFTQSISEPVKGFEPAALRVMRRMIGEE